MGRPTPSNRIENKYASVNDIISYNRDDYFPWKHIFSPYEEEDLSKSQRFVKSCRLFKDKVFCWYSAQYLLGNLISLFNAIGAGFGTYFGVTITIDIFDPTFLATMAGKILIGFLVALTVIIANQNFQTYSHDLVNAIGNWGRYIRRKWRSLFSSEYKAEGIHKLESGISWWQRSYNYFINNPRIFFGALIKAIAGFAGTFAMMAGLSELFGFNPLSTGVVIAIASVVFTGTFLATISLSGRKVQDNRSKVAKMKGAMRRIHSAMENYRAAKVALENDFDESDTSNSKPRLKRLLDSWYNNVTDASEKERSTIAKFLWPQTAKKDRIQSSEVAEGLKYLLDLANRLKNEIILNSKILDDLKITKAIAAGDTIVESENIDEAIQRRNKNNNKKRNEDSDTDTESSTEAKVISESDLNINEEFIDSEIVNPAKINNHKDDIKDPVKNVIFKFLVYGNAATSALGLTLVAFVAICAWMMSDYFFMNVGGDFTTLSLHPAAFAAAAAISLFLGAILFFQNCDTYKNKIRKFEFLKDSFNFKNELHKKWLTIKSFFKGIFIGRDETEEAAQKSSHTNAFYRSWNRFVNLLVFIGSSYKAGKAGLDSIGTIGKILAIAGVLAAADGFIFALSGNAGLITAFTIACGLAFIGFVCTFISTTCLAGDRVKKSFGHADKINQALNYAGDSKAGKEVGLASESLCDKVISLKQQFADIEGSKESAQSSVVKRNKAFATTLKELVDKEIQDVTAIGKTYLNAYEEVVDCIGKIDTNANSEQASPNYLQKNKTMINALRLDTDSNAHKFEPITDLKSYKVKLSMQSN